MKHEALQREYRSSVRMNVIFVVVLFFLVMFFVVSLLELTAYKFTKNCSTVGSYKDAQSSLKSYPGLDKNHDGVACNGLKPEDYFSPFPKTMEEMKTP